MTPGKNKSRRLRKVQVRTCKGTNTHFRQENRQTDKCAVTKKPLRGLPRLTNKKFAKLNKSQKTISRPYGGYMSHQALKDKILNEMVLEK